MTHTILVPGLFGCQMVDSQKRVIWPPGETTAPIDTTTLTNLLSDPATKPGKIIDRVLLCGIDIYGPVIDLLSARGNFTPFAYDWRVDIRSAAAALAQTIAALPGKDDIQIVAHSMGGIVARWLLEGGEFSKAAWFPRIKLAVFIATPHLGAPMALFRIMGNDSQTGALAVLPNWATKALASNPTMWPSAYQLLTPSGIDCVTRPDGTQQDIVEFFGQNLSSVGITKMQEVQTVLERFAKPPATRYVLAYGKNASTVWGILATQAGDAQEQMGDGDGTVPTWSAEPTGVMRAASPAFSDIRMFIADHIGIIGNRLFLQQLQMWLDGTDVPAVV